MTDIIAEIDEALRRERMEKLWHVHGNKVIGALLALVLATAVYSGYQSWYRHTAQKQTAQVLALLEHPDFPGNALEETHGWRGEPRSLSLLQAAKMHMEAGKTELALEIYRAVANDQSAPEDFRHLANLMRASLRDGEASVLLEPIASDSKSPFQGHAHLALAAYYAHGGNDLDRALSHAQAVAEIKDAPESLVQKAQALSHIYRLQQRKAQDNAKS